MHSILILIALLAGEASASPYYRFWQGWKLDKLSAAEFQRGLEETLIPRTIDVGAKKGLIAYLPWLVSKPDGRPDEIALVIYLSEAEYKAIRETPEGKEYGELHWTLFDKDRGSKSAVTEPFKGVLEVSHAYDVLQSNADWQKGYAVVELTRVKANPEPFVKYLGRGAAAKGLQSYVVLRGDGYVVEYQLWRSKFAFERSRGQILRVKERYLETLPGFSAITRKSSAHGSAIRLGEALNTQFGVTP